MVVSDEAVDWNWRQAGREQHALFYRENLCVGPGCEVPAQWWPKPISILTIAFDPSFLAHSLPGLDRHKPVELLLTPTGDNPFISHSFGRCEVNSNPAGLLGPSWWKPSLPSSPQLYANVFPAIPECLVAGMPD